MLAAAAAVAFALVGGYSGVSHAASVEVGTLSCKVEGGAGFIIGSSKGMRCVFDPAGDGPNERYTGSIDKLGVDIGFTNETRIVWAVLAPSAECAERRAVGHLCRRLGRGHRGCRHRRQCAGRRAGKLVHAAAPQRSGSNRP